ncbi:MAG: hypothetical protein NZ928_07935 [Endomicrobia bacterium]|nr:hypothetical protein [Endomicrobiia bacterium]MDW8056294.1 hypothetical protein [Elusimicrobiota bacterium]
MNSIKLVVRYLMFGLIFFITASMLVHRNIRSDAYNVRYSIFGKRKLVIEDYFVLDSIGIIFGLRKLVSDIAWIQLLQYYGGEPPEENHHCTNHNKCCHIEHLTKIQPGKYKKLIDYCRRVTTLDPLYSFVYFYGVGALAWNLERPDEALEYLNEGLENLEFQKSNPNSDYWELVKYQQAIYYKLGGKYKEMLDQLKVIIQSGRAPNMVKAILANLYKKYGYYTEALEIWHELLFCNDPEYVERAKKQIVILNQLIKNKKV